MVNQPKRAQPAKRWNLSETCSWSTKESDSKPGLKKEYQISLGRVLGGDFYTTIGYFWWGGGGLLVNLAPLTQRIFQQFSRFGKPISCQSVVNCSNILKRVRFNDSSSTSYITGLTCAACATSEWALCVVGAGPGSVELRYNKAAESGHYKPICSIPLRQSVALARGDQLTNSSQSVSSHKDEQHTRLRNSSRLWYRVAIVVVPLCLTTYPQLYNYSQKLRTPQ